MLNHQESHFESTEFVATKKVAKDKHGDDSRKHGLVKDPSEKYKPISIRLHPKAIEWARAEAEKRGIGYQSVINEVLLDMINA